MMKITLVCLFLIMAVGAQESEEKLRALCGRTLAQARILYCYGTEYIDEVKQETQNIEMPPSEQDQIGLRELAWRNSESRSKRIPGIIDECCLNPCTVSQLLSYC